MELREQLPLIHKPALPVLIVEDIRENQIFLQQLCKYMGLTSEVAENGSEALQMMERASYSIYIVDLMMPIMDGRSFILELKRMQPDAVVLIQTALDSSETIIDTMKLGVFDYLIKPIDPEAFQNILRKALDFYYLKTMEKQLSLNAGLKLRHQLEWLNYKETRRKTAQDSTEILSIENLKTSLSQGAGVGSMVTLVDLLKTSLQDNGDTYIVRKEIIDLLIENNEYIHPLLEGLHAISDIMQKDFDFAESDANTVVNTIPLMIKDVIPYIEKKGITLTYPLLKNNAILHVNIEKISQAIEELLINAYKYTPRGGSIDIYSYLTEGYFCISVKNDISESPYGGIPPEFEKLVTEPFFRLLPPDESIARVEKFGLGLGLTVVEHIARKHNGLFFIHDIKDHTGTSVRSCVVAEFLVPHAEAKGNP